MDCSAMADMCTSSISSSNTSASAAPPGALPLLLLAAAQDKFVAEALSAVAVLVIVTNVRLMALQSTGLAVSSSCRQCKLSSALFFSKRCSCLKTSLTANMRCRMTVVFPVPLRPSTTTEPSWRTIASSSLLIAKGSSMLATLLAVLRKRATSEVSG